MPSLTPVRRPKLACALTLALVFVTGAMLGAVAMNTGHRRLHAASASAPFWTASGKAIYLEKVKTDLDLTPAQTEQLEMILDDFAQYYRTVLSEGKARIFQILDEEQQRRFERMIQESQR